MDGSGRGTFARGGGAALKTNPSLLGSFGLGYEVVREERAS